MADYLRVSLFKSLYHVAIKRVLSIGPNETDFEVRIFVTAHPLALARNALIQKRFFALSYGGFFRKWTKMFTYGK